MYPGYAEGQRVKIIPLIGSDGRPDPLVQRHVDKTGTVARSYCITRDEFPDLSKMFVYPDVYCCDVRLDGDGAILPAIPEVALEPCRR